MVTRRDFISSAATFAIAGCASAQETIQREFAPGQVKTGSHLHALQAASFVYGFTQGHMLQHEASLERVEDDTPAFFEALERAGWSADVTIVAHTKSNKDLEFEYYDVDLVLAPKDPKARDRFVLPGAIGTSTAKYVAALAPAAAKTGIAAEVLRRGHFALFALATQSGTLNATDDSMKRYAFGLLVLREKLKRGESRVDYLAPLRPANESLEDVEMALRVVADHHRATSQLRAEIVGLTALARTASDASVRKALLEQIAESRKAARTWLDTHERPTMEEYGVALKEFKLPTPENLLAVLDKEGYVTAALTVAKGVASGDAATTVEGLGKLAPKDSSVRIASEGVAAALRGDIAKTVDSVISLAQKQEDIAPLVARLRSIQKTVENARDLARSVPTSKSELEERVKKTVKPPRAQ